MADRRRGMVASTRTSVPSHLSLALPSCERRLTILSPHTHTPSTPAAFYSSSSSTETAWHFCTSSAATAMSSSASFASHHSTGAGAASTASGNACGRPRKKCRPGMVLPRLVLPGSSDLDIFSQFLSQKVPKFPEFIPNFVFNYSFEGLLCTGAYVSTSYSELLELCKPCKFTFLRDLRQSFSV
ncbi:hypothetical protein AGLY_007121 [Aphis glycines]|uniref:Uncharacterized protein n=1 Tax=Aphis glycines TaxID=307491 RepID=A0A6G0TNU9_APHGL|nr:hypothetical protein AGLY_007121 [Aphis glycines]